MLSERELEIKAVAKWGKAFQIKMAIEEFAEAIHALAKHERNINPSTLSEVIDELADAEIMLNQMKLLFGEDKIAAQKQVKLERLEKLIGG